MSAEEEERAMAFRQSLRARNANRLLRERQLAGSVAYRQQMADDWAAVTDAQPSDIPPLDDEAEERIK